MSYENGNIYRNGNQALKEALEQYRPSQILYVPLEIGKYNHKAKIVNFLGDVLIKPVEFANSKNGLKFILEKIKDAQKIASAEKIFCGCESCGHYHLNIVYHLKQFGLPIEPINPRDVRKENPNKDAKNDLIDLNAIARTMIYNKGTRQVIPEGVYYKIQRASRTRMNLVRRRTSSRNIITGLVDRIFPGLWDKDDSVFSQRFGKASLLLLEHYPYPKKITLLGEKRLSRFLRKNNTKLGEETAKKIVQKAMDCLSKPEEELEMDILSLRCHIKVLYQYEEVIQTLEKEIALLLLQTPGTYLLSIPGIGVEYASQFTAEVGDIRRFAYANQIICFAGICSRVFESSEYEAKGLPMTKMGSKFLRTTLNQIALSLNAHCNPFRSYYQRKREEKKDRPGIARIATGNRFVKLAFALMRKEELYRPRDLVDEKKYYVQLWKKILEKLEKIDLNLLPKENYLIKIKKEIEDKYGLKLSLEI